MVVKGVSRVELFERLGLVETGETLDFATTWIGRDETGVALLPNGRWLLITGSGLLGETATAPLSSDCEVVGGMVEEHVMVSAAWAYKDGKRLWSVEHDDQAHEGRQLVTTGAPPSSYSALSARAASESKENPGVDYFIDVPLDLALEVSGYRPGGYPIEGWDEVLTLVHAPTQQEERRGNTLFGRMWRWGAFAILAFAAYKIYIFGVG